MKAPRLARFLLRQLSPRGRADEVVGDLEEAHGRRRARRGPVRAWLLTWLEALDVARALVVEQWRDRDGPGESGSAPFSLLDFKLGLRMLARYPALTLLAGLALSFAIFSGAGTFEFVSQVVRAELPFEDGERIVGIRMKDRRRGGTEMRIGYDLGVWRSRLRTVEEVGAFSTQLRTIVPEGADGGRLGPPVVVAEMSASGFRITGVPPLYGRTLVDSDEASGAPPVAVLGYDLWRGRFGGDPEVVGRSVRVGRQVATVVGIMPEGFAFPVWHDAWMPLPRSVFSAAPLEGVSRLRAFGRLAPGASLEEAQVELSTLAEGAALELPDSHEHLRPRVASYTHSMLGIDDVRLVFGGSERAVGTAVLMTTNLPLILFVFLVCGNVALLMFARTVAREEELVVRSALGASRVRIVGQLFAEAFVLAGIATVVGLLGVSTGLDWTHRMVAGELWDMGGRLPFWLDGGLSTPTVLYAVGLALLAAAIAGIVPALKVTRGLGSQLRAASAGGGGFRFGGMWTAVVVVQVAVTALFPLFLEELQAEVERATAPDIELPTGDFIGARIEMDRDDPFAAETGDDLGAFLERYRARVGELEERLAADPRVRGITLAERLPRVYHPWSQVEIDGPSAEPPDERGHRLGTAMVRPDYFRTLGVEPVAGRDFTAADVDDGSDVVIVNESFVHRVLGGRSAVGVRLRYVRGEGMPPRDKGQDPYPWLEIVGVVRDLGTISGYGSQGMYHPARIGSGGPRDFYPAFLVAHVPGTADAVSPGVLQAAAQVDAGLRIDGPVSLDEVTDGEQRFYRFWFTALFLVGGIAVLLSMAGIYSIMSFTVSQRTREIGIRVALGSGRGRVVTTVLRRPLGQVGLGIVSGVALIVALGWMLGGDVRAPEVWITIARAGGIVALFCALACLIPARRALSVDPSEALRADG